MPKQTKLFISAIAFGAAVVLVACQKTPAINPGASTQNTEGAPQPLVSEPQLPVSGSPSSAQGELTPGTVPAQPSTLPPVENTKVITILLNAENKSGVSGTATLQDQNGKTKVELKLSPISSTPEPAHIHVGSCPNPGAVKYALSPVVKGQSETVVPVSLATLKAQLPLAINVHKSEKEITAYISCGDIHL